MGNNDLRMGPTLKFFQTVSVCTEIFSNYLLFITTIHYNLTHVTPYLQHASMLILNSYNTLIGLQTTHTMELCLGLSTSQF